MESARQRVLKLGPEGRAVFNVYPILAASASTLAGSMSVEEIQQEIDRRIRLIEDSQQQNQALGQQHFIN